jgi:hypothetical protein
MSDKYNGWTNYETWNAAPWMDQDYYIDAAKESESIGALADYIKEDIEETMPENTGMWADLQQSAFDSINWFEIAEHIYDDANEEE